MARINTVAMGLFLLSSCGAGQYGYTRTYEPLGAEGPYAEAATLTTYEDVRRDPEAFIRTQLGWFGVVTNVDMDPSTGRATVALEHRTHQERHLCADERRSSCRVTVSDRSGGPFSAVLTIRGDDRSGSKRLWRGSLLKVYGSPNGDYDSNGGPVLDVPYYRHWPLSFYVTTGSAGAMRR